MASISLEVVHASRSAIQSSIFYPSLIEYVCKDGEEHERLDLQHAIYTLSLGSLYPAHDSVKRALAPRQYGTPAILDLGTGSGSWCI